MMSWLDWLDKHDGLGTWLGGLITAAALAWALVTARADARRANQRAMANLLAADDALSAMQEYLETTTEGRTSFHDVFDQSGSWLSIAPFERFRLEMSEVEMSILPSQWSRRALRRARAIVEETALNVAASLDPVRSKSISSPELAEVAVDIRRCRQALSVDLAPKTPWTWLVRMRLRRIRPPPTRLGQFN